MNPKKDGHDGYCEKVEENPNKRALNDKVVSNLSRFIKRNKKLIHINLDSTQLHESMIFKICEALSKSKSVQALHASDNPGLTNELRNMIIQRLHGIVQTS